VLRRAGGSVSGKASSAARVSTPIPTSVQKIARQPAWIKICPPSPGPTKGAMAITVIRLDIIRAAWAPA